MKGIESDPAALGFRPDAAAALNPRRIEKKKEKGSVSFFSLFRPSQSEEEAPVQGEGEALVEQLEKVVDQVHGLGEELARHPSNQNIQNYKKQLKLLVQTFVDRGLVLEKHISNRNILQQKSYQIIKVIDEKLEKLVVGILQSQFSQIEILSKVEEIQGLLVNLLY